MARRYEGILLVEDNPDDRDLALVAFERAGLRVPVATAQDGVEALEYLFAEGTHEGEQGPLPRVVLLDWKLPRLPGLEVLRRIRADERTRDVPVVVLTSSLEARDLADAYAAGANSYVRKPVELNDFVEVTRILCQYWTTLNRAPGDGDSP